MDSIGVPPRFAVARGEAAEAVEAADHLGAVVVVAARLARPMGVGHRDRDHALGHLHVPMP
jgi:hypothetical protein